MDGTEERPGRQSSTREQRQVGGGQGSRPPDMELGQGTEKGERGGATPRCGIAGDGQSRPVQSETVMSTSPKRRRGSSRAREREIRESGSVC